MNDLLHNIYAYFSTDGIRETFEKTNFHTVIDRNDIFVSLHDAVQHAESRRDTQFQVNKPLSHWIHEYYVSYNLTVWAISIVSSQYLSWF